MKALFSVLPANGQAATGNPGTGGPKTIVGRKLARKRISPEFRALLAHELRSGAAVVTKLTIKQSVQLAEANVGYVTTLGRLTAEQLEQVKRRQVSLSVLHNKARPKPTPKELVRAVIAKVGADVVMAVLDEVTAPAAVVTKITTPVTNGANDNDNDKSNGAAVNGNGAADDASQMSLTL